MNTESPETKVRHQTWYFVKDPNISRTQYTDLSRAAFHRDGFQEVVEGHGVVLPIQILH